MCGCFCLWRCECVWLGGCLSGSVCLYGPMWFVCVGVYVWLCLGGKVVGCVWVRVCLCVWFMGEWESVRSLIYLASVSLSQRICYQLHQITHSFDYISIVRYQLYWWIASVYQHFFISNVTHDPSYQSNSHRSDTHSPHTHLALTQELSCNSLPLCYRTTFHARQPLTHRPYLHSPYAQMEHTLLRI